MQIWAHRAYHDQEIKENTILGLKRAVEKGFKKIEFDTHLVAGKGFFLKHDSTLEGEELTLPNLDEFLNLYGDQLEYWIDLKNISLENIDEAESFLGKALGGNKLGSQIYLASRKHKALEMLGKKVKNKGLIFQIITEQANIETIQKLVKKHQVKNISINHHCLNQEIIDFLNNEDVRIFTYTAKDLEEIEKIEGMGIFAVASDYFGDLGKFTY